MASHESGWIFVVDEDLKLVSGGGGARRRQPTGDEPGPVIAASFSPDGTRVAMSGLFGVVVVEADQGELRDLSPRFPAGWAAWSSDSRFVIVPARRGVYIHDLQSGEVRNVLVEHSVVAATVLPSAAS